mmetsp:Transcript_153203/g.471333  ORF Transcript_153203/g.471333 Transcript_153203/m.471333 type:complete len:131 (-) Transcript_153203:53-445(-)
MDEDANAIEKACEAVFWKRLCREPAQAVQQCLRDNAGQAGLCQNQHHRFSACASEAMPQVVRLLTATASQRCPSEVSAFQRCVKTNGGGARGEELCEASDQQALACAARALLEPGAVESARIPAAGAEWS